uniref:zinc finger protein 396-like n=1 Tax=Panthera onca TaxID=9690 RepID=UPI002953B5C9
MLEELEKELDGPTEQVFFGQNEDMLAEKLTPWEIHRESPNSQIKPIKKQLPLTSREFHSRQKGEGQDSVHGGRKRWPLTCPHTSQLLSVRGLRSPLLPLLH